MRTKLVLGIYLVVGVVNVVIGARYFFSQRFLSYHAEAVSASWQDLDAGVQATILALMTVAGGGWLALGFFTIVLALAAFRSGSVAARWALPGGTLVFYSAAFAATWGLYQQTGASTPWWQSIAMIGTAMLALIIDAPWSQRGRDKKIV